MRGCVEEAKKVQNNKMHKGTRENFKRLEGGTRTHIRKSRNVISIGYEWGSGKKTKFREVEKCQIETKEDEIVPQSPRGRLREHLKSLVQRGVIRLSNSRWRNLIRAIERPNGDVRLAVSSSMELRRFKNMTLAWSAGREKNW